MPTINLAGTSQALDTSLPTIFSAFKLLYDDLGVMRSCADKMTLKPHEGTAKRVINYGRLSVYALSDGVEMAQAQELSDAATTYTPSEVGGHVWLAGTTMRRIQDPDLLRRVGKSLAQAYDLKEDTDGTAQLTSFVPIMGAAGDVISPGFIAGAMGRLAIGNDRTTPEPFPGPYFGVLHPLHALVLAGRLVPYGTTAAGGTAYGVNTGAHAGVTVGPGRTAMSDEIIRRGFNAVGEVAGATIKRDANIAVDSGDDASGAVFSQEGLKYVSEVEAKVEMEPGRKTMRGAMEVIVWGSYIWGLWRSSASGCEILADASLPTS